MLKNKIAIKLVAGFAAFMILCVSILGVLFVNIFAKNHINYQTEALLKIARQVTYLPEVSQMDIKKLQSESKMLEFLDYSSDSRVWIVDKNMHIVALSTGEFYDHEQMGNCLLPQNDMNFMNNVISGKDMVSNNNINFYDVAMLSVGVPIFNNGEVVGAVLLHTSIQSLGAPIRQTAFYLIVAIIFSTIIIMVAVWFYSISFTRPLKRMKDVAKEMIDGNYTVKTNILKNDEIGDLANSMDILADRLEDVREETQKLDQIRRDFVANVSHEFRTPLTVIKGDLETLIDNETADAKGYYDNMLMETNALEKLVSDLLDLSRIESGKLEFEIEEVDASQVISDVLRSITPIAKQKGVTIDTNAVSVIIPPIYSDYYRLRQVLIIFLTNAIKYTEKGKKITISTDVSEDLTIMIKDQGHGISGTDLPYVWDRFYKADKMRSDNSSSGLGLAIAKNLITALGGKVKLESEIGIGTSVIIKLPLGV